MNHTANYVLIVGSSNMDLNIYSKRFPNPGETVTGGTFKQFLGGKGANHLPRPIRAEGYSEPRALEREFATGCGAGPKECDG